MPELPEVETIARRLALLLPTKQIATLSVIKQKSFMGNPTDVVGTRITHVSRRAKILQLHLENSTSLLIHLKMTGQLIYVDDTQRVGGGHPTDDWVRELPSKHTRVIFGFSDGSHLYFNDMRIFGWIKHGTAALVAREFLGIAPDVIDAAITPEYVFERFGKSRRPLKVISMDNSVMSGLGNIYACDALNLARLDPARPANSLSFAEVDRFVGAAKEVLELGIRLGGATLSHYRHVDGFSGRYQEAVRVYNRAGKPCLNCGHAIEKYNLAGRGTYWCPACQK